MGDGEGAKGQAAWREAPPAEGGLVSLLLSLIFDPGDEGGGEDAEGQGEEKLGGRWPQSRGEGRAATVRRVSSHFPPGRPPSTPGPQGPGGQHFPRKVGQLEFHERAFQAWGPHRERPARAQASKFPSRTSCPSQLASAAARQGWGGRGRRGAGPRQLSLPREPEPRAGPPQALRGGDRECVCVHV